jgi:hypothetical protein
MVEDVWDVGASSEQTIGSAGGFVEFSAAQTNKSVAIGLSNEDLGAGYTSINYAVMMRDDGFVQLYEKGIPVGTSRPYAIDDIFRISVEVGILGEHVVKYYQNGEVIHTSEVTPTFPLRVDVSLKHKEAVIRDVTITGYWRVHRT